MLAVVSPSWAPVCLATIVALSILLMLFRPKGIAEVYWVSGGVCLLLLLHLVPVRLAARAIAEGLDVYLFLIGMMLVSGLAEMHGVFDWLSTAAICQAQGSGVRLFTLVYAIGAGVTIFLSNDATAVVLTPAMLTVAKKAKVQPEPHLFACALVANAASFALPISNPANLVVFRSGMPPLTQWLRTFALPSALATATTYFTLRYVFRKRLQASVQETVEAEPLRLEGRLVLGGIAVMVGVLLTASALHANLGLPACATALVIAAMVSVITHHRPSPLLRGISWSPLALVAGLFVMVDAIESVGVLRFTAGLLQRAGALAPALGTFAVSTAVALGNNLVNNLPLGLIAGKTLGRARASNLVIDAVLIGVDLGPNLSVTGSLATILWLLALRKQEVRITPWQFFRVGAVAMPIALAAAVGGLLLVLR